MEWLIAFLQGESLSILIPILIILGIFSVVALRAHHKHQERIEKIKRGFDPEI